MKRYKKVNYKKIILNRLQKIIQVLYMGIFIFLSISVSWDLKNGFNTPKYIYAILLITGFLSISKVYYLERRGVNNGKEKYNKTN